MLEFTSGAVINSLYWICSLDQSQRGTTFRVLEDLEPFLSSVQIRFEYFEPNSSAELKAFLAHIAAETNNGARPLIHFDLTVQ
jgi:hypothetical protein